MTMKMKKAMMTSISEVLETMFFVATEMMEDLTFTESKLATIKDLFGIELKFSGALSGMLMLLIPNHLGEYFASSLIGQDVKELKYEDIEGSLKELANMIIGNTFSYFNNDAQFKLGIPKAVKSSKITNIMKTDNLDEFIIVETLEGYFASGISYNK